MKHGTGQLTRSDGSRYRGTWQSNTVLGAGQATIVVGDPAKRDGLKKEVDSSSFKPNGLLMLL